MSRGEQRAAWLRRLRAWGRIPVPAVDQDEAGERARRGVVTLAASIRGAQLQRQASRRRWAAGLAVAAGLLATLGGSKVDWGQDVDWGQSVLPQSLSGLWDNQAAATSTSSSRSSADPRGADSHESHSRHSDSRHSRHSDPLSTAEDRTGTPLQGRLSLQRAGISSPLAEASTLAEGDILDAASSGATIRLGRVTRASFGPEASLSVATLTGTAQRLELQRGRVDFSVDPEREATVSVTSGETTVLVTGTRFSVETGGPSATGGPPPHGKGPARWTQVRVERGHVLVTHGSSRVRLQAGDTWSSDAATDSNGLASTRPDRALRPGGPGSNGETGMHTSGGESARTTRAGGRLGPEVGRSSQAPGGPLGPTTLAEENRLFREALAARNQGNGPLCVSLLTELTAKHPKTPLRQEALVARFRCLAMAGDGASASRAAANYLASYPRGFAREEARRLVLSSSSQSPQQ